MANRNLNGDVNVEFTEASSRQGLDSGESVKTLFGKIRKWLSDLKAVAFSGSYNDLTNKPTIPPAVAVKGSAETAYRTGNVNLTAANIGAATSAQGTKADSAVQTIQMNGNAVTKTSGVVDLGTVITAHQDISGKADKSATVSTVTYDTTNKKLTKTINNVTSDIASLSKFKVDMILNDIVTIPTIHYNQLPSQNISEETYFKEWIAYCVENYSEIMLSQKTIVGVCIPNSRGSVIGQCYNVGVDSTTGLPRYCRFVYISLNGNVYTFGTNNYAFSLNKAVNTVASQNLSDTEKANARANIGLDNVNNTSDLDKPISTATQAALDSQQEQIDNAIKRNENNNVNYIMVNNITIPFANNAGFHNSIYRGKNLGTSYTAAQKAQVQAGTFDDLFVGDYWAINNVNWRIAHFDYYLNTGDTATTKHHLVIVPDTLLANSYMNATNVTTGAYVGSYMYTTTLLQDGTEASDSVFGKIKAAFGESNLLSIRQLFANAVDSNGNVSGWAWYSTRCFLMNQTMVYGHKAWANGNNDGYNVGADKSQLALFAHNPTSINIRQTYWLRDVRSSTSFALVRYDGYANHNNASKVLDVRPAVLLS